MISCARFALMTSAIVMWRSSIELETHL